MKVERKGDQFFLTGVSKKQAKQLKSLQKETPEKVYHPVSCAQSAPYVFTIEMNGIKILEREIIGCTEGELTKQSPGWKDEWSKY